MTELSATPQPRARRPRPKVVSLTEAAAARVREIAEIRSVKVDLVFDPPWDPSRMSDEAKLQLNMF